MTVGSGGWGINQPAAGWDYSDYCFVASPLASLRLTSHPRLVPAKTENYNDLACSPPEFWISLRKFLTLGSKDGDGAKPT